jgi:hypothetical protein
LPPHARSDTRRLILCAGLAAVLKLGSVADMERYVLGAGTAPARMRTRSLELVVPADDTVVLGIG